MKKQFFSILGFAALTFLIASCGSTPKPDTIEEDFSDIVQDTESDINSKIDDVKQTFDNSSALEKAENARQAAIDAGADKSAKNQFDATDKLYKSLKDQAEAGADVSIPLADVEKRFAALEQYAKALEAKKKIEDRNLVSYDEDSYNAGCKALSEFEDMNSTSNLLGTLMYDKAKVANNNFVNVLNKAYKKLAKEARTEAFVAKKDADSVKAAVAAKSEYQKAADEFKAGDTNYAMQNAESAYNHYLASKEQFNTVYTTVSEKRAAAQKAIDEAKAKVLESLNASLTADKEKPLEGDDIQGIEAEDAVLLEADEYVAPESQEADIPEDITDVADNLLDTADSSLQTLVNDAVNTIRSSAEAK